MTSLDLIRGFYLFACNHRRDFRSHATWLGAFSAQLKLGLGLKELFSKKIKSLEPYVLSATYAVLIYFIFLQKDSKSTVEKFYTASLKDRAAQLPCNDEDLTADVMNIAQLFLSDVEGKGTEHDKNLIRSALPENLQSTFNRPPWSDEDKRKLSLAFLTSPFYKEKILPLEQRNLVPGNSWNLDPITLEAGLQILLSLLESGLIHR